MSPGIHTQNGHGDLAAEADAEGLRLPSDWAAWRARKRRGRVSTAAYLGGGLPLDWLARAARLRHKAFQVAVMLWHVHNLQKAGVRARRGLPVVRLEPKQYARFGVHRNTVHRALAAMAREGLVVVAQEPGYPPEVTLVVGPSGGNHGL